MATILTKKSDTSSSVPLAADLTNAAGGAELAVNTADKRLYSKTSGGSVVELGTNPSALSLPNGTANGVPYLNGSKVLTSGSALTFDGTNLGVGVGGALRMYRPDGATYTSQYMGAGGTGGFAWDNQNADGFKWLFTGSEQMRLTSTGLGIGTSSPAAALHVASGNMRLTNGSGLGTANALIREINAAAGASNQFVTSAIGFRTGTFTDEGIITFSTALNASTPTERMRLDQAGNLGLGVTPSAWYSTYRVLEGVSGSLYFRNDTVNDSGFIANGYRDAGGTYRFKQNGAATQYQQGGGVHYFYTSSSSGTAGNAISFTQAMTLDASGNLLVGATSAGTDKVRIAAPQTSYNNIGLVSTDDINSGGYIAFRNSATTEIGSIKRNGASAVSYNTTSDYRLKTVIGAVSGAGQRIDALEPIEYEWKVNGERTRGFLAHKFQEVYAGSVTGTKDAVDKEGKPVYQAMQASSSEVIADLVAEIQSLRKRLAALESK